MSVFLGVIDQMAFLAFQLTNNGIWQVPVFFGLVGLGVSWTSWAVTRRVVLRWTEESLTLPTKTVGWREVIAFETSSDGLRVRLVSDMGGVVLPGPRDGRVWADIVRKFRRGRPVPLPVTLNLYELDEGAVSSRCIPARVRIGGTTGARTLVLDERGLVAAPLAVVLGFMPAVRSMPTVWLLFVGLMVLVMIGVAQGARITAPRVGRVDLDAHRVRVTNGWGIVLVDVLWDDVVDVRPDEAGVVVVCLSGEVRIDLLGESADRAWAVGQAIRGAMPPRGEPVSSQDRRRLERLLGEETSC